MISDQNGKYNRCGGGNTLGKHNKNVCITQLNSRMLKAGNLQMPETKIKLRK